MEKNQMDRRAAHDMAGNGRPQSGDVLIVNGQSRGSFDVSTAAGERQITCTSFEQALASVRRFAARARVDIWMIDEAGEVRIVASHRVDTQRAGISEAQERQ
jgi:hypothetical protein